MVIFLNNAFKKRIDELGRIVIPKQLREKFKINSYDELDIFIKENGIFIKKNIGLLSISKKINNFINFISKNTSFNIIIYDGTNIFFNSVNSLDNFDKDDIDYNIVVPFMNKYICKYTLIIDSNYLGDVIFVSDILFDKDSESVKEIKSILCDLIK